MAKTIIIGTRGSELALWQAYFTRDQLLEAGHQVEIKIIQTKGDAIQHLSLDKIEGKGFFTKELEEALLNGSIDLAVHSHKDLPTTSPPGLHIAGVSFREDCSESMLIQEGALDELRPLRLKEGAVVGTSSYRRRSQLLHFRPDLLIKDIRGNVPTRIKKLQDGNFDAILLASAGLNRIEPDLGELIREVIPPHVFIPAPAQGVLAFQTRENDLELRGIIKSISDEDVQKTIVAERLLLNKFQGGCLLPLGAYCEKVGKDYQFWASFKPEHEGLRRVFIQGNNPEIMALRALSLLKRRDHRKVFISRDPENASLFISQLSDAGFQVIAESPIRFEAIEVAAIPLTDWVFFNSPRAVTHFIEQELFPANIRVAAMGSGTDAALREHGIIPSFTGGDSDTRNAAHRFLQETNATSVLFPVAEKGLRQVQTILEKHIEVHEVSVYRSVPRKLSSGIDADLYVFTSPSSAEAFNESQAIKGLSCIAIGTSTSSAIQRLEGNLIATAPFTSQQSLADTVCGLD